MYKETSKISYYLPSISVLGISDKLNLITEKNTYKDIHQKE